MKFRNIYKLFILLVLFVTLQSRSTGPGGTANLQVTGAPGSSGSNGTCANSGCHASGSFDPSATIQLLDGSDIISEYQPGVTYNLKVDLIPGNGTPSRYGFQAVSLDGSNNQAGSWGNLGSGKQTVTLSNRSYVEHNSPAMAGSFEMEWVAPDAGTGGVTFYSAGIASNFNGGTSGDGMANTSLSIGEATVNSVSNPNVAPAYLSIFPNPVNENLNLKISSRISGAFSVRIIDVLGKEIMRVPTDVSKGDQVQNIPVGALLPGLYIVQLSGEKHLSAVQMLKN